MNNIKKKGILLAVSILLLLVVGIYFTLAWYTKMTSVGGMNFNVAKWDFDANYSIGDLYLNVYSYTHVNGGLAAPGTSGEMPILLSAEDSDTDISFLITIDKTTMSNEFQERIYFYKDKEMQQMITPDSTITGIIDAGGTTTVKIYWKWIYEFSDIPTGYGTIENETAALFNEFDTAVGKRPDLYESKMNAAIRISGLQTDPVLNAES